MLLLGNLRKNLIANYLGQAWVALMNLAFVPIYIQYLGIESYGLIGFFVLLQAWLTLLDMGMSPTLNREMGRFSGGGYSAESIRDLLRSIEAVAILLSLLVAFAIACSSDWLARNWLKSENIQLATVAQAIGIMGIVAALRFIEGIYRSCLIGLQKQVRLNVISFLSSTLQALGAIAVLKYYEPTI